MAEPTGTSTRWHSSLAAALTLVGIVLVGVLVFSDHGRATAVTVLVTIVGTVGLRSRPMQLSFAVGDRERHRIVFRFNRFWGNLSITADGNRVVDELRMFSANLAKTYEFDVGSAEVHHVRIEKEPKLAFAGFRPQPVRAYVDGVLAADGAA